MPTSSLTTGNTTIFDSSAGNAASGPVTGFYVFNNADSSNTATIFVNGEAVGRTIPIGQMVEIIRTGKITKIVATSGGTATIDYGVSIES